MPGQSENKIVAESKREEIFCALKTLANSSGNELPENLQGELKELFLDENFLRELNFQQNSENTNSFNCFLKNFVNDPRAISFGLHTVANVGSLAAFIILYKKFNNRQKVNQVLGFISAFSTWGVYAHQAWRRNNCTDC